MALLSSKAKQLCTNSMVPIILSYWIPHYFIQIATQMFYYQKACLVDLDYNVTACAEGNNTIVQRYVVTRTSNSTIFSAINSSIMLLLIGAWSDRHRKRKLFILLPMVWQTFGAIGHYLSVRFFYETTLILDMIVDSFAELIGGHVFLMALFSHVVETSSNGDRTLRVGAISIWTYSVSSLVGPAISGFVYHLFGFNGMYIIAICVSAFGIVYTHLFMVEPKTGKLLDERSTFRKCVDFLNLKHTWNRFSYSFQWEGANRRYKLVAILLCIMTIVGPVNGEFTLLYMFLLHEYNYSATDFSLLLSFNAVIHVAGSVICLTWLYKHLKTSETAIGVITCVCKMVSSTVFAFAPNMVVGYIAVALGLFNGSPFFAIQAILAQLVPAHELGIMYSLFYFFEGFGATLYVPIYSAIYKWSLEFMPGLFFLASSVLMMIPAGIFGWLHFQLKPTPPFPTNDVIELDLIDNEVVHQ